MHNEKNAGQPVMGGALPGDGEAHILLGAPPCANISRSFADRINAHGYAVARNPNRSRRRRDEFYARMQQRVDCLPVICK